MSNMVLYFHHVYKLEFISNDYIHDEKDEFCQLESFGTDDFSRFSKKKNSGKRYTRWKGHNFLK